MLARSIASGVLLLSAAAAPAGAAAPVAAVAGADGPCPDDTGVTVVVDFTELGGPVVVRCAPGPTGTGIDALSDAGFTLQGTERWGTAFICRIQGRPAAGEELPVKGDPDYTEQCLDTPPTQASWAYSYAENGGRWTYSSSGATSRRAIEGGFEGWRFTLNGGPTQPSVAPLRAEPEPDKPDRPDKPDPPDKPEGPDKPDKPERADSPPQQESDDGPAEPRTPEPTESPEPTDEPTQQPTEAAEADDAGESPAASRPDKGGKGDKDKPDRPDGQKAGKPDRAAKPRDDAGTDTADLGTTSDGAEITGELPAESAADAEESAASGSTTLLGAGLIAVLGAGAGLTAWRRRSRHT